jgi:hypothetical protein
LFVECEWNITQNDYKIWESTTVSGLNTKISTGKDKTLSDRG